MATITVPRGQRVAQTVPVVDPSTGRLDARWLSTDTPVARVWAGQERAHVALTAAWDGDPAAVGAKILVTVTETVSADLADGRWPVDLLVTRSAVTTSVGGCYLSIVPGTSASNSAAAPRSYITGRQFRDVVGPIADTLQTKYGQTSNAHVLNLATLDLDDAIARRYSIRFRDRGSDESTVYGDMMTRLAGGGLEVTEPVKRYTAWRTLWYLTQTTVGGGDELDRIRNFADAQAVKALRAIVAYVDGLGPIPMGGAVQLVR
jgi:hypothetical protein